MLCITEKKRACAKATLNHSISTGHQELA